MVVVHAGLRDASIHQNGDDQMDVGGEVLGESAAFIGVGATPIIDTCDLKTDQERDSNTMSMTDTRLVGIDTMLSNQGEVVGQLTGGGNTAQDESKKHRIDAIFEAEKRAGSTGNTQREQHLRRQREDLEDSLFSGDL